MGNTFNPGDSTDLRGYAIRISHGRVFYFNSDGILVTCTLKEADMMQLQDMYRKTITGPWMLKRSFTVSGYNNKNAFKSAAAKMRAGNTMSDFYHAALSECMRQSTKPHKEVEAPESRQFILDVHLPEVYPGKKSKIVKVVFVTNTNLKGTTSVLKAANNMNLFIKEAKKQLWELEEFEDVSFFDLPKPDAIKINEGRVVVEFRI